MENKYRERALELSMYKDVPNELDNTEEIIDEFEVDSYLKARVFDLLSYLGTKDFKVNLDLFLENYKFSLVMKNMRYIQDRFLERIKDIYDFEFLQNTEIKNKEDFEMFISFLRFFEFDNIFFMKNMWKLLIGDVSENFVKIDFYKYLDNNKSKINMVLSEYIRDVHNFSENKFITFFLITYYKLDEWFIKKSKEYRFEIYLY